MGATDHISTFTHPLERSSRRRRGQTEFAVAVHRWEPIMARYPDCVVACIAWWRPDRDLGRGRMSGARRAMLLECTFQPQPGMEPSAYSVQAGLPLDPG